MSSHGDTEALPVRFVGSGSEYFRIWIVNLLLTLVTLGFYYPFAKVRRLRYFFGATEVGGHPLSFHADPWKMLRGYLLVGVLVAVYSVAGRVSPIAGLIAFAIVAALWPALWHSSLRFRLANTGWRGLRFRFTGQRSGAYAALLPGMLLVGVLLLASAIGAPVPGQPPGPMLWLVALMPLVLLAASPALLWRLRRYQHSHYALAAETTGFDVPMGAFYGIGLRSFGLGLVLGVGVGVGFAFLVPLLNLGRGDGPRAGFWLGAVFAALLLVLMQITVVAYASARMQNRVWNGTRSEHLAFESRLGARALIKLSALNALLTVCTLGLYFPFAAVATARLRLEAVNLIAAASLDSLVAQAGTGDESAAGDAAGDLFGLDIGL